uniref:Protein kinase domain-containing protein n=1 Tax=Otus sunia TaxID=257818 RepID=A0A8C8AN30_9STRI
MDGQMDSVEDSLQRLMDRVWCWVDKQHRDRQTDSAEQHAEGQPRGLHAASPPCIGCTEPAELSPHPQLHPVHLSPQEMPFLSHYTQIHPALSLPPFPALPCLSVLHPHLCPVHLSSIPSSILSVHSPMQCPVCSPTPNSILSCLSLHSQLYLPCLSVPHPQLHPVCLALHVMPWLSCLLPIFGPRHALGLTHVPWARAAEINAAWRHGSGQESLSHSSQCWGRPWVWGHPAVSREQPALLGHTAGDTGPMEEPDEDGEDNEEFLERLMAQTGREMPQRELEEHYTVLEELGSGTYGRVVLTEPLDGGPPVVLKLMLKERTEWRAFLREYCIALCLSSHAACLRALPVAFESATHFAFGQELAPAGDLCALLNPGVRAAPVLCWSRVGSRRGGRMEERVTGKLCSGCSDAVCGEMLCSAVHGGNAFCSGCSDAVCRETLSREHPLTPSGQTLCCGVHAHTVHGERLLQWVQ